MYKYIIWDFDGTLIDSYPEMLRIYSEIFKKININPDMEDIKERLIRYSSKEVKEMLSEKYNVSIKEFDDMFYEMCGDENSIKNNNFLNDSKEALVELKKLGCKNFIFTDKNFDAVRIIDNLNALDLFEEIVYVNLNDNIKRKPDPSGINYIIDKYSLNKAEVVCVGDRDLDCLTALNAGIDSILYRPIEGYTSNPRYIIQNFMDLVEIVKNKID